MGKFKLPVNYDPFELRGRDELCSRVKRYYTRVEDK